MSHLRRLISAFVIPFLKVAYLDLLQAKFQIQTLDVILNYLNNKCDLLKILFLTDRYYTVYALIYTDVN